MSTQDSVKQPSHCDELAELLPAFSAGALNSEDVEKVKNLLQKCPDMHLDLAQYTAIMSAFYERILPVLPPKHLHDKLMRKVRAKSKDREDSASTEEAQTLPELLMTTQTDLRDD
jgi:hypothetical protein